jgi:methyl-accepting chemotaxis protein
MRATIAAKLAIGFGVVIGLLALSAGTAYYNLGVVQRSLSDLLEGAVAVARAGDRVLIEFHQASADLRGYLAIDRDSARANHFKSETTAAWRRAKLALGQLTELTEMYGNATERQLLVRINTVLNDQANCHAEIMSAKSAEAAEHIWESSAVARAGDVRDLLGRLAAAAEQRRTASRAALEAACRSTMLALGLAAAGGIVAGIGVAFVLSRRIVTTVRALADRAQKISEGDLRGSAIAAPSADELGQLADGFNVMIAGLRDLTGQILSVTENVNSAAAQISSSSRQQASSTKEQAATVQEITSTMQEISQAGAQIVARAKEVAAVAEQASAASASGMEAVNNTNRTMEAIREQVEDVAENIVALSEKTQAVGEIIATVNEIAEQSNLLALNATIEAADAGQEGNRFSVVAAEMKNLADQAKQCTIHVRKILGEIQKAINTSVMLTEEAVKRVESGKRQADVSESVIRQISSTTEESIQAFQQIIGATNQQQVGFEQVARGMQDIDQAARQTAAGTGQLEQAVVSLSALGKQLRTAVAMYKV